MSFESRTVGCVRGSVNPHRNIGPGSRRTNHTGHEVQGMTTSTVKLCQCMYFCSTLEYCNVIVVQLAVARRWVSAIHM